MQRFQNSMPTERFPEVKRILLKIELTEAAQAGAASKAPMLLQKSRINALKRFTKRSTRKRQLYVAPGKSIFRNLSKKAWLLSIFYNFWV